MWNLYNISYISPISWHEPSCLVAIKWVYLKSLWMSYEELLPEERKGGKYLSLLTLLGFNKEKILKRVKINISSITYM